MKAGSTASTLGVLSLLGVASVCQPTFAADLAIFGTQPAYEPPPCSSYWEKTFDNGTYKYLWCRSNRPGYEARLDIWKFANGAWSYYRTSHYDCQNTGDFPLIPPITKQNVC